MTLPILNDEGEGVEWWKLLDGTKRAYSQLELVREGLSTMLEQADGALVALERDVVPLCGS
jgi:hypothetical protein